MKVSAPASLPVLAALLVIAVPPLLVPLPPLLDYPDHYARLWLFSGGAQLPPLDEIYALDWSNTGTNFGIELVAATIGHVLPLDWLSSIVLIAALLLPPLGAVLLHRSLFGGWHWWQAGFAFLAWNETMLAGFVNFQIGLGLALLAAAADRSMARRGAVASFAWRAAAAAVLIVAHIIALFFYAALLGGLLLGPRWRRWMTRDGIARPFWRGLPVIAAVALPLLLYLLLAPALPGEHAATALPASWGGLRWKITCLLTPFLTYHHGVDLLMAAALAAPVFWALIAGRLRVHAGLAAAAALLALASLVLPNTITAASQVDARFPIMAVLALVAALRPELGAVPASSRPARQAALAFAMFGLVAARTAWVGAIWEARARSDIAAVRQVLAQVPPGAAVMPVIHEPSREVRKQDAPLGRYMMGFQPSFLSLPALAVPERRAFVPILYAARGRQPLRVLPPWQELTQQDTGLPSVQTLLAKDASDLAAEDRFVLHWRDRYQYLLVLNADLPDAGGALPELPELRAVADAGFAQLYRITGVPAAAHPGRSVEPAP